MNRNFLCFLVLNIYATANSQVDLDPVTVVSSPASKVSSETGRNIITVKGESFAKLPVNSLDELLRYIPGVEVQQRGPQGAQADILLRGGTFQQVLIILDGIRINDPLTGHFNSYIPITPGEIDRIEILKGTASAIYGSDAVGGVIHIISKTFAGKKSKSAAAKISAGEYGMMNAAASGYYHKGNTSLSAGVLTNNSKGVQQRGIRGYFHNTTASASFRQQIKLWSVAVQSSYDKRDFAAQNFYTVFASDTATEDVSTWWNHLQVKFDSKVGKFSFDAGYKTVNDHYVFNPRAAANDNKSATMQGLLLYTRQVSKKLKVTAGSQYLRRWIGSNDRGNHTVDDAAIFLLAEQKIGQHIFIQPSLRYDRGLVPQLNFAYNKHNWVLRAAAGKAVRDADFTEQYNNYGKQLVSSGNIGNENLERERSWNFEAGGDYFLGSRLKHSATLFTKQYSNLIDWVPTIYINMPRKDNLSPVGNYYLASNVSSLRTQGTELDEILKLNKLERDGWIYFSEQFTNKFLIYSVPCEFSFYLFTQFPVQVFRDFNNGAL